MDTIVETDCCSINGRRWIFCRMWSEDGSYDWTEHPLGVLSQIPLDMRVGIDIQSAFVMANNRTYSWRSCHIKMLWHYRRKQVQQNLLQMEMVRCDNNSLVLLSSHLINRGFDCYPADKCVYDKIGWIWKKACGLTEAYWKPHMFHDSISVLCVKLRHCVVTATSEWRRSRQLTVKVVSQGK